MKNKTFYIVLFCLMIFGQVNAQIACNTNVTVTLDADGVGEVSISDMIASDVDFLLSQYTMTYLVFPFVSGEVTSSEDLITLDCLHEGTTTFIVEITDDNGLVSSCWSQMIVEDPLNACPGNGGQCDVVEDCSRALTLSAVVANFPYTVAAESLAICSDDELCTGDYTMAVGTLADVGSLTFVPSIDIQESDDVNTTVVLAYDNNGTLEYDQTNIYVWSVDDCIFAAKYNVNLALGSDATLDVSSDDFLTNPVQCAGTQVAITELGGDEPDVYSDVLTLTCDNAGYSTIYLKNSTSGLVVQSTLFLSDPQDACGIGLEPGQKLITIGATNAFFSTSIKLNDDIVLDQHPSGGWIVEESELLTDMNTITFDSGDFNLSNVSTLDLVYAVRLIIENEYDYPMQPIVFDFDASGYLGLADLITAREGILGFPLSNEIPNYLFRPLDYTFIDFDPFNFTEDFTKYDFEGSNFENENFEFKAYKMGDFSGADSFKEDDESTNRTIDAFEVSDIMVEEGETFTFNLNYANGMKIKGMLAALVSDEVVFNSLESTLSDVQYNVIEDTELRISYLPQILTSLPEELSFQITATAGKSGKLIDLLGLKAGFPQEIVSMDNELIIINNLEEEGSVAVFEGEGFENIEIYPNPFMDKLIIQNKDELNLQIMVRDALGRSIMQLETNDFEKLIDMSSYDTGVYYISVIQGDVLSTQMVVKR